MSTALEFTEDQAMILDGARAFCAEKSPMAAVRVLLDSETGYDPAVWEEMVALGWPALAIPEQHGGAGLGIGTTVPLAEAMGRALLSTPFFSVTLAAQAILRGGTEDQQATWLPELASGTVATLALLDGGDWGVPTTTCTATREGGSLRLDGAKQFVSDAGVADAFLVWCTVDGADALVLVPRDALRAEAITPHVVIDQTKRAGRVDFTGVTVAAENMLDQEKTTSALRDVRLLGAMLVAAEATGSTAACLDVIVDYLKTRKQFGQYIGSYQALKHPTVDILCAMDSARSLIYHAATVVGESPLDEDAESACRMAKAQAGDALAFAGDRAVQFHGGMGFTYECDAQLFIRRGRWLGQLFGDASLHRARLAST
ncbi:MAG: acyl-CoA dehydrogenase family protein [Pseudomonadales bacterium]|jgi:alkylation response protein AidB-like acyl-CoA dehydrogenase|nr:acyl-CoA dehydrogenase family protein [Pseudomonadales bacterium]